MRFSLLVCLVLASGICLADVEYVDITDTTNIRHSNAFGPAFSGQNAILEILQQNMGNGAAVGDYDNDGDLDIYILSQLGRANVLYRNEQDRGLSRFSDVTPGSGLDDVGQSRVAHFVDLDNDGWLDLVLLNETTDVALYPASRIWRNLGNGQFEDVTSGSGFNPIGMIRCGMSFGDYDGDGLLDIYVTNWGNELNTGFPVYGYENQLYKNLGNFTFDDRSISARVDGLARDSFTAIFHDFDEDHDADIYVAVDHSSDEYYENTGLEVFTLQTTQVNMDHFGNDMGAAAADFDDDGDLDVYTTNITDPDGYFGTGQNNVLYVNQLDQGNGLSFINEASARGVEDSWWGWGTEFVDVENDGDLDLVAVTGYDEFVALTPGAVQIYTTPTVLYLNDGTGNFSRQVPPYFAEELDSRGLVAFDWDRDGDEDLLILNVNQAAVLLDNQSTPAAHWLTVSLEQSSGSNRSGIGGTIYATIGSTTKRRDIFAGESFLVGTPAEAHFGLGSTATIDELRVEWTDGTESTWTDVAVDRHVTLRQGIVDVDADGFDDATDCDATDAYAWGPPSTIDDLFFDASDALSWGAPNEPGSTSVQYDLLRSGIASDFAAATCLVSGSGTPNATDAASPAIAGELWSYLVRADSGCGQAAGDGRSLPSCP